VLLTPVLIMTIPILDTSLVTITRRWAGRPVSEGGRDHLSHRLVALGISERQAVLILYALAAVCGTLALAVRWLHKDALLVVIPAFGLATLLFALYLGRVPLQPGRGESRAEARTLPEPLSAGRRAGEILMDVALVCVAYGGAYLLRWGFPLPPDQRAVLGHTIPLVVVLEVGAFLVGGIYRELGRQPRVKDLVTITRSAVGGASCSALVVMLVYGFHGPSRGVLVLNGVLLLAVVTASRLCLRLPAAARGLTRSASGPA
jgi:UDP-GlcNAc:undecaprenyl-phosphate GlcNAc-1-phosphate transferase